MFSAGTQCELKLIKTKPSDSGEYIVKVGLSSRKVMLNIKGIYVVLDNQSLVISIPCRMWIGNWLMVLFFKLDLCTQQNIFMYGEAHERISYDFFDIASVSTRGIILVEGVWY